MFIIDSFVFKKKYLYLYLVVVFKEQNKYIQKIKKFIKKHSECNLKPIIAKWGFDTGYGRQILSGQDNMDGFFYACLKKNIKC